MIVTTLFGGLGNQMFIYSMAKALAIRNNETLLLDRKSGFKRDFQFKRSYALNDFSIIHNNHNKLLTFDFPCGFFLRKISQFIGRHILCPSYRIVKEESNNHFDDMWLTESIHKIILSGYWMNEKYFKDFESEIRKDFTITKSFEKDVLEQKDMILNSSGTPVAIGVRVYQEITDIKIRNSQFFTTDKLFYENAMKYISELITDPVFYIFTEVPEWVKENINMNNYKVILIPPKQGNDRAIDDMYLMSLCKHFIISNSSFYWWGTWLCNNNEKIVIIPKSWSNKCTLDTWIKL